MTQQGIQSRPSGPRGFTMVEIAVVVAVVGLVGAVAAAGVSTAAETSKRSGKLKAVYAQLEQIRARHLSASSQVDSCLRMTRRGPSAYDLDERPECDVAGTPKLHDFRATILAVDEICIDALARPASCANLQQLRDVAIEIEIDGRPGCDGVIVWRSNGRLTANFAVEQDPGADVQPHLSDAASSITPRPTAVGSFEGATTNPRGLLE